MLVNYNQFSCIWDLVCQNTVHCSSSYTDILFYWQIATKSGFSKSSQTLKMNLFCHKGNMFGPKVSRRTADQCVEVELLPLSEGCCIFSPISYIDCLAHCDLVYWKGHKKICLFIRCIVYIKCLIVSCCVCNLEKYCFEIVFTKCGY